MRWQVHACCMTRNHDSLTRLSQHQYKWQKWWKDVIRHKQSLFSSPWMPLWGSIKMTSLPRIVWRPWRNLARLVWAVPISWWLPIGTLTRLIWAPCSPGRRWGWSSPGPRWLLPSCWVQSLVSIFQSILLFGFLDLVLSGLQLSRMTFHGNFWRASQELSQEWESARTDLLVVSKDLCFGAPRLVRIDEYLNLEVLSWDCRRSLGLDNPFEQSRSARLHYLWGTSCPQLVFSR